MSKTSITFPPPPQSIDSEIDPYAELKNDPMTELVANTRPFLSQDIVNNIVLNGDLSKLSQNDLTSFYIYRCKMLGLDPAAKPFDLLTLGGKKVLYANKSCAASLRDQRHISTAIIEEREWNGLLTIKVRAWYPDGRQHEDEGFSSLNGLSGDALGNARLKAITKATRRAILHLCGLGEMDETEVESIPGAKGSVYREAQALLIPKQAPSGSDAIQIIDIKGVNENNDTVEVLDSNNRVWYFRGKEPVEAALKVCGQPISVLVNYVVEGNQYVVEKASI